jgi:hypothetical protein
MGTIGDLRAITEDHPLAYGAYLSVETGLMEAKIENTGLMPFLAIFGNSRVIVIGHKVNIWGYEGKEQRGWCYGNGWALFLSSWGAFMGGM